MKFNFSSFSKSYDKEKEQLTPVLMLNQNLSQEEARSISEYLRTL